MKMVETRNERKTSLLIAVVATVMCGAACRSSTSESATADPSPDASESALAKTEFWDAFGTGKLDAIPAARDHLLAALANQPKDDELARLVGMSYLTAFAVSASSVSDGSSPPATAPQTQGGSPAMSPALQYLKQAVDVSEDPHQKSWNGAFYGTTLWATGHGSPAQQQEGRALIDALEPVIPVVALLTRGSTFTQAGRGTADFAAALDSYFHVYELCMGKKLDRSKPDITLTGPFPDARCGNIPHVPHNIQGELLTFADGLVKNGQPDVARTIYETIKRTDGFDTWAFRAVVDQRLSSDLAKRASLYTTADTTTQPPVGLSCLSCHQR